MTTYCPKCAAERPSGPLVRGQRLCVACGDQEALYWKERAIAADARASREETATLVALAELDEARIITPYRAWLIEEIQTALKEHTKLPTETDTDKRCMRDSSNYIAGLRTALEGTEPFMGDN